jgi:hypothetical protein
MSFSIINHLINDENLNYENFYYIQKCKNYIDYEFYRKLVNNNNFPYKNVKKNSIEREKKFSYITKFVNINNPINDSCSISLIDFNENTNVIQIKKCKHIFSINSINNWFKNNNNCPNCRMCIL